MEKDRKILRQAGRLIKGLGRKPRAVRDSFNSFLVQKRETTYESKERGKGELQRKRGPRGRPREKELCPCST